jgi:hypothetical protein
MSSVMPFIVDAASASAEPGSSMSFEFFKCV